MTLARAGRGATAVKAGWRPCNARRAAERRLADTPAAARRRVRGPTSSASAPVTERSTLRDLLPSAASVTAVSTTDGTCDPVDAGVLRCRWATLAVGRRVQSPSRPRSPTGATTLTNSAVVSSASADPSPGDNTATATTNITTGADVRTTKTLTSGGTIAGSTATWTITVRSAGPGTATKVVVVDTLPVPLRGVTATPSVGTCAVAPGAGGGGGTARCAGSGPLAAGAEATVTVTGTIDPSFRGVLTNVAAASASNADPDPTNNAVSASSTVTGGDDLTIAKRVDRSRARSGRSSRSP